MLQAWLRDSEPSLLALREQVRCEREREQQRKRRNQSQTDSGEPGARPLKVEVEDPQGEPRQGNQHDEDWASEEVLLRSVFCGC
jgi:hypothetical protein